MAGKLEQAKNKVWLLVFCLVIFSIIILNVSNTQEGETWGVIILGIALFVAFVLGCFYGKETTPKDLEANQVTPPLTRRDTRYVVDV